LRAAPRNERFLVSSKHHKPHESRTATVLTTRELTQVRPRCQACRRFENRCNSIPLAARISPTRCCATSPHWVANCTKCDGPWTMDLPPLTKHDQARTAPRKGKKRASRGQEARGVYDENLAFLLSLPPRQTTYDNHSHATPPRIHKHDPRPSPSLTLPHPPLPPPHAHNSRALTSAEPLAHYGSALNKSRSAFARVRMPGRTHVRRRSWMDGNGLRPRRGAWSGQAPPTSVGRRRRRINSGSRTPFRRPALWQTRLFRGVRASCVPRHPCCRR
jgi:hypothetical protein